MRTLTFYSERPNERETIRVGDRASVFIRANIEEHTIDGDEPRTEYSAIEYSTTVNANGFELTDEFVNRLIEIETNKAAASVRAKRNALLDASDKEMTVDRIEREPAEKVNAWKEYRQELRDITKQEGFPFDVVFPQKP